MYRRPAHFSDAEWVEYQRCQTEHDELMTQVADREAQIEAGFIDSYDEYEFTWAYNPPAPPVRPSSAASRRPPASASRPAPTAAPQQPRRR